MEQLEFEFNKQLKEEKEIFEQLINMFKEDHHFSDFDDIDYNFCTKQIILSNEDESITFTINIKIKENNVK